MFLFNECHTCKEIVVDKSSYQAFCNSCNLIPQSRPEQQRVNKALPNLKMTQQILFFNLQEQSQLLSRGKGSHLHLNDYRTLQCFQGNERLLSCLYTEDAFWRCSPSRWLRLHLSLHLTDSITLDGSPRKLCNRSWSRETESHLVNVLYHLCAAEDWHLWFS